MARFDFSGTDYGAEEIAAFEDLLDRTEEAAPYWDDYSPSEQREIENQIMEFAFYADYDGMENLLNELGVEWDADDWEVFREMYG